MNQFVFTSTKFSGFMRFGFDDEGILNRFENHAKLDMEQTRFLRDNFPFTVTDLPRIQGKHGKFAEDIDISFEAFWKAYNYTRDKKNAMIQWSKLDDNSKAKAISYITKYRYECQMKGFELLYASRYLKYRRFEDE